MTLLLGALVLLVARLKPVWLVLGMGYLAGTLISNLAFQAMLMLYFHSSPSIGYLLESSLIALASAAVFAGVLWLFVRTLTVLRQPELGSAACEGVAPLQMGLGRLLFSFTGRITRSQFWLTNLCLFPFSALGWALALSEKLELILVLLPLVLLLTFCGVSLSVKRLHDRDKGSWWLATTLIPLAGLIIALWLLVEIWFLRGTRGVNRFGPDPLQPSSSAETTLHLE